jgi:hypothetical protein
MVRRSHGRVRRSRSDVTRWLPARSFTGARRSPAGAESDRDDPDHPRSRRIHSIRQSAPPGSTRRARRKRLKSSLLADQLGSGAAQSVPWGHARPSRSSPRMALTTPWSAIPFTCRSNRDVPRHRARHHVELLRRRRRARGLVASKETIPRPTRRRASRPRGRRQQYREKESEAPHPFEIRMKHALAVLANGDARLPGHSTSTRQRGVEFSRGCAAGRGLPRGARCANPNT